MTIDPTLPFIINPETTSHTGIDADFVQTNPFIFDTSSGSTIGYVSAHASLYQDGLYRNFFNENGYLQGLRILYDIPAVPIVASSFLKLTQDVSYLGSSVKPTISYTHAKWVEETLKAVDIDRYFQSCLLAYITGVTCAEMVWRKRVGAPTFLSRIKPIPIELIRPSSTGIDFVSDQWTQTKISQGAYKFLKFNYSHTLSISPLGDGVGKLLHKLLQERNTLQCYSRDFARRGASPLLIITVDRGVKKQIVEDFVRKLHKADTWKVVAVPSGIKAEALEVKGNHEIYQFLLTRVDKEISDLISGENIVGSNALSGSRGSAEASNVRRARSIALAKSILKHINDKVVRPIVDVRFGVQTAYPEFSYALPQISKSDLPSISDILALHNSGFKISPEWIENAYGVDILGVAADKLAAGE